MAKDKPTGPAPAMRTGTRGAGVLLIAALFLPSGRPHDAAGKLEKAILVDSNMLFRISHRLGCDQTPGEPFVAGSSVDLR
jgi:hypothetical protein